jgi:bacterioferritin-associated ferredoxin
MIVCQCKGTTDRQIRDALTCGAHGSEDVGRQCGAGTACGGCRTTIEVLVRETRRQAQGAEPLSSVA